MEGSATTRSSLWPVAALFALTPIAARADIRAVYGYEGGPPLVVEVTQDGDARITEDESGYFLILDGEAYWVEPGPGGPVAIASEARAELSRRERRASQVIEHSPDPEVDAQAVASARKAAAEAIEAIEERVADMPADVPDKDPETSNRVTEPPAASLDGDFTGLSGAAMPLPLAPKVRLVVTDTPDLAPLGEVLFRYLIAQERLAEDLLTPSEPSPLADQQAALVGKTPLAYGYLALQELSQQPVAAERFALPADVVRLGDLPPDSGPDLERENRASIVQAVFAEGALWTLDDAGTLWRTSAGEQDGHPVQTPGRPSAICRSPVGIWLVTLGGQTSPLRLWQRENGGDWQARGEIAIPSTVSSFGLECSGDTPLIYFGDRVVLDAGKRTVRLDSAPSGAPGFTTLLRLGDALYVGANAGEWGGGLRRIDLATGRVDVVQGDNVEELCGGILNAAWDPVTGLTADPARPGCLLATVGLVHFFASGEVVRVCGTVVERAYRKPYTIKPSWTEQDAEDAASTVPFFGLAGRGEQAWAVAADGLYRFGRDPTPELTGFPRFRASAIDWSHPDVVLVPTDMNGRHSLSGSSLLLAPR